MLKHGYSEIQESSSFKKTKKVQISNKDFPRTAKDLQGKLQTLIQQIGEDSASVTPCNPLYNEFLESNQVAMGLERLEVVFVADTGVGKSTVLHTLLDSTSSFLKLIPRSDNAASVTKYPINVMNGDPKVTIHLLNQKFADEMFPDGFPGLLLPEEKIREICKDHNLQLETGEDEDWKVSVGRNPEKQVENCLKAIKEFGDDSIFFLTIQDKFPNLQLEGKKKISLWDTPGLNEASPIETKKSEWVFKLADVLLPVFALRADPMIRYLRALVPRFALSRERGSPMMIALYSLRDDPFKDMKNPNKLAPGGKEGIKVFEALLKRVEDLEDEENEDYTLVQRLEVMEDLQTTLDYFAFFNIKSRQGQAQNKITRQQFFQKLKELWDQKVRYLFEKGLPSARACLMEIQRVEKLAGALKTHSTRKVASIELQNYFRNHYSLPASNFTEFFLKKVELGNPNNPQSLANLRTKSLKALRAKKHLTKECQAIICHSLDLLKKALEDEILSKRVALAFYTWDSLSSHAPLKSIDVILSQYEDNASVFLDDEGSTRLLGDLSGSSSQESVDTDERRAAYSVITAAIEQEFKYSFDDIEGKIKKALKKADFSNVPEHTDVLKLIIEKIAQELHILLHDKCSRKGYTTQVQYQVLFGALDPFETPIQNFVLQGGCNQLVLPDKFQNLWEESKKLLDQMVDRDVIPLELITREVMGNLDESLMKRLQKPTLYNLELEKQQKSLEKELEGKLGRSFQELGEAGWEKKMALEALKRKLARTLTFPSHKENSKGNLSFRFDEESSDQDAIPVESKINTSHGNRRVINIKMNSAKKSYQIELYPNALVDIEENISTVTRSFRELLSNPDCKKNKPVDWIYPIFIPSKGRHGEIPEGKKAGFLAHLPISSEGSFEPKENKSRQNVRGDSNTLKAGRTLLYLFVEEQELDSYMKGFENFRSDHLILVVIPGRNRGVGFARQMILLLQQFFAHHLKKNKSLSFDYFFILDDDLVKVEVYDRDHHAMRQCSLELALSFAQDVLLKELNRRDNRLKHLQIMSNDENKNDYKDVFEFFLDLKAWIILRNLLTVEKFCKELLAAADQGKESLKDFLRKSLLKAKNFTVENTDEWGSKFWDILEKIRIDSTLDLAMVSLSLSRLSFDKANYNLKQPEATHRISDQHYAAILFHAPALRGYGYLSAKNPKGENQLFLSQDGVQAMLENKDELVSQENGFLSEDKALVERLKSAGRGGYQIYLFAAQFGNQKVGGCHPFRTKAGANFADH